MIPASSPVAIFLSSCQQLYVLSMAGIHAETSDPSVFDVFASWLLGGDFSYEAPMVKGGKKKNSDQWI